MALIRHQEILVMSRASQVVSPSTTGVQSFPVHRRVERALMSQLHRFGRTPIRRATQTRAGVLRIDGPDAAAVRSHALSWVRGQLRERRYPQPVLHALHLALSDMSPEDVAGWVMGYLATTPHIVP